MADLLPTPMPVAAYQAQPFPWIPLILCALAIAFVAFSIWRLKQTAKGVLKTVSASLLATAILEALYFILGSLLLPCTFGRCYGTCVAGEVCGGTTKFTVFASELPVTAPIVFGAVLIICYAVLLFRTRTKSANEKN